ncbi:MAG TPA: calcium-binding protein [Methylomusa anaerophila]|uniref:Poly(Beta-D-mannuronate) C5 epimerase 2 n=1 Tax=Methylomusa anaerophila TaxID=1930071 RepID=A0A348AKP8_9FIRM|nr:calcium-binding protein [Methylomusa anaerophila]BBB91646.1 poly(beta-D-mannuronate) C5 epimerase 2 [Methylomusa anaerophila]HML88620.1 calcium-binding protein [Methylomusa anaerophila]
MALSTTTLTVAEVITKAASTDSWVIYGNTGGENITGSAFADTLYGLAGADTLVGGNGDDLIVGGTGNDTLTGGADDDTFRYSYGDGNDSIADFGVATDVDILQFTNIALSNISFNALTAGAAQNITMTGGASIRITNDATANNGNMKVITSDKTFKLYLDNDGAPGVVGGSSLADFVLGGIGGGSTLIGGTAGADTLQGQAGSAGDVYVYRSDLAKVNALGANDTLSAAVLSSDGTTANNTAVEINLYDTKYTGVENVVGGGGRDTLRGSSLAETLDGGNGGDILWGGAGNDSLTGGAGNDTYWFGTGDGLDSIVAIGGGGADGATDADVYNFYDSTFSDLSFAYNGADLVVTVGPVTNYDALNIQAYNNAATNGAKIFQTSDLTFRLLASSAGPIPTGTTAVEYVRDFVGAGGVPLLDGGGGADTVVGGDAGNTFAYYADTARYIGGSSTLDVLTAATSADGVEINLYDTKYSGIEKVTGSTHADTLRGTSLADSLTGGGGADNLWGGAGNDTLTGTAGASDTYWFGTTDGNDTITAAGADASDYIFLYDVSDAHAQITSMGIEGADLVLHFTGGAALTIAGWTPGGSANRFRFEGNEFTWQITDPTAANAWARV